MIESRNISWYLQSPERLLMMKPFTRGGTLKSHGYENESIAANSMLDTGLVALEKTPISQDTFLMEYSPDLHHIILNQSIPHIKVVIDGWELPSGMMELTQTAAFQKLIHAAHVRSLTTNDLEITACNDDAGEDELALLSDIKKEWTARDNNWHLYEAIKTCKKVGNVGVLFSYDKSANRYDIKVYSYEDGYQTIPHYNEYGAEIARSLVYNIDGTTVIDTFDATKHYRTTIGNNGATETRSELHGFPVCPLLFKRGKVAWEYAESSIEMWELMTNIGAIALKRFGTFALVLIGDMDGESFKRDSSTLVINLSSDTANGKQDAKVLDFPEPETLDKYLKTLEEKISLFSSTTFITPKDISMTNSGGNGIALAMSNDYAMASQSAIDWRPFARDMVRLHQEGLFLEKNKPYNKIALAPKIIPWSLETNNTKITNLAQEGAYLSTRTIVEKMPDAAPDEIERIIAERGSLTPAKVSSVESTAQKAQNIAINKSNEIIDNKTSNGLV